MTKQNQKMMYNFLSCRCLKAVEVPMLIAEVAKSYAKDKKMTEQEAVTQITSKLCATSTPDMAGTTVRSQFDKHLFSENAYQLSFQLELTQKNRPIVQTWLAILFCKL